MKGRLFTYVICFLLIFSGVSCTIEQPSKNNNSDSEVSVLRNGKVLVFSRLFPGEFTQHLIALQEDRDYHIVTDCYGGSAHDTIAIVNRINELRKKGFSITTEVYGYAFSGGAVIFLTGDKRIVHDGASIMIHGAGFVQYGKRQSLREYHLTGETSLSQDVFRSLELIDNTFITALYERTWMSMDEVMDWMYKYDYNFMSSEQALELGVATEIK